MTEAADRPTGPGERPAAAPPPCNSAVPLRMWTRSPRCVPRARRHLRRELATWGLHDLSDTAELVLSELITNAVRHACPPRGHRIATRYQPVADGVRIEVHDANETWPEVRKADDEEESGRGLALVDALTASRWGVAERDGIGKLVWAVVVKEAAADAE